MERTRHKVELYIIPRINQYRTTNEIDDVKAAHQSKFQENEVFQSTRSSSPELNILDNMKNEEVKKPYDIEDLQNKVNFALLQNNEEGWFDLQELNCCSSKNTINALDTLIGSLTSFSGASKAGKSMDNLDDKPGIVCCHGYKNGCTTATMSPEKISQEVFEENWLKKLEILKYKEGELNDREVVLESREKLLTKKEKEIKAMEKLAKGKLKQAELYLRRSKNVHNLKYNERCTSGSTISSHILPENLLPICTLNTEMKDDIILNDKIKCFEYQVSSATNTNDKSKEDLIGNNEKLIRNPPNSQNSLVKNHSRVFPPSHGSFKFKQRQKLSYDDLDSTLSADIGDASFVITSRKFDPEQFKKPTVFRRTASERLKTENCRFNVWSSSQILGSVMEEQSFTNADTNKVLKRFSENISVSQDKSTKFQYYGLIDENVKNDDKLTVTESYNKIIPLVTDIQTSEKLNVKSKKSQKERPMSWTEETNEWLQRKRQAYNVAVKGESMRDLENKENNGMKLHKIEKSKGKGDKIKRFGIFR